MGSKEVDVPAVRQNLAALLRWLRKEQRLLDHMLADDSLVGENRVQVYELLLCVDHRLEGLRWGTACLKATRPLASADLPLAFPPQ